MCINFLLVLKVTKDCSGAFKRSQLGSKPPNRLGEVQLNVDKLSGDLFMDKCWNQSMFNLHVL